MRLRTLGGLWIENADGSAHGGVRPRRLAVLAVLAAAGAKGLSRDQLLAILWPESASARGRAALSQTLYSLRADLGVEVVLATRAELRLDPTLLTSDLHDFRTALKAREWRQAAALYGGPFLDGFYLTDAPLFERWAEEERAGLTSDGVRAIEHVARDASGPRPFRDPGFRTRAPACRRHSVHPTRSRKGIGLRQSTRVVSTARCVEPDVGWRCLCGRARHNAAARVDRHRRGNGPKEFVRA